MDFGKKLNRDMQTFGKKSSNLNRTFGKKLQHPKNEVNREQVYKNALFPEHLKTEHKTPQLER